MTNLSREEIESILLPLMDRPSLECDGFSRIAFTYLFNHGVDVSMFIGELTVADKHIPLHFWIETGEFLVDYKARRWLGDDPDVPHGIMLKKDVADLYDGSEAMVRPLPDYLIEALLAQ